MVGNEPDPALAALETERRNDASAAIDRMNAREIVALMNEEDAVVVAAVREILPAVAQAVEGIVEQLRRGGRLIYVGTGTSGRLGVLDASECPPTFSTPPEMVVGVIAGGDGALRRAVEEVEDRPEAGRADVADLGVGERDVVTGIASSGRTPYVLGAVEEARERGALTIGIACNRATPLEARVDIVIAPIVGAEIITGSTRLKAGTATKMVLNMLSTGAMVLLGKTYGNLMVDLRATNSKLRDRSLRILQTVTGLPPDKAAAQLRAANGEVKTAIVAALTGLSPSEARRRLTEHGGQIESLLTEVRKAGGENAASTDAHARE